MFIALQIGVARVPFKDKFITFYRGLTGNDGRVPRWTPIHRHWAMIARMTGLEATPAIARLDVRTHSRPFGGG